MIMLMLNKVFRQRIGIAIGTDYTPLMANLCLFYYEKPIHETFN